MMWKADPAQVTLVSVNLSSHRAGFNLPVKIKLLEVIVRQNANAGRDKHHALAVHHLAGPDKADLFTRIGASLRSGGRFVLGDVVVPLDPSDAVTPLTDGHDRPSLLADQLAWLVAAGFVAAEAWRERDLVVVRADRP